MTEPMITAGIDVGTGVVKAVVMAHRTVAEVGKAGTVDRLPGAQAGPSDAEILAHVSSRIRRREIPAVIDEVFGRAVEQSGVEAIHYVASTGEGEEIPFATGHFYGMTTHARGALFLEPRARSVLDVGALHARAVCMDGRGKVQSYKMTSQCASGSGQFLENIARYLGVSQEEIGPLSLKSQKPEKVSSICAVLAETDVINMVSRGITTPDILRGIHESMGGRFVRLLRSLDVSGVTFFSGGLAGDAGLQSAVQDGLNQEFLGHFTAVELVSHPLSIFTGAIGAALWGAFRHRKLELGGLAWKRNAQPISRS